MHTLFVLAYIIVYSISLLASCVVGESLGSNSTQRQRQPPHPRVSAQWVSRHEMDGRRIWWNPPPPIILPRLRVVVVVVRSRCDHDVVEKKPSDDWWPKSKRKIRPPWVAPPTTPTILLITITIRPRTRPTVPRRPQPGCIRKRTIGWWPV